MTAVAVITTGYVGGGLAAGDGSVVTANTGTEHLSMIHRTISHRPPGRRERLMAGITAITAVDMGA